MDYIFSPSLMCMDLTKLKEQIDILNSRAGIFHVDIMDGHFVKNITLSPFFIEQMRPLTKLPIDAHLMVENPDEFIDVLKDAGTDYITIHAETIDRNAFRIINKIKDYGLKVGIALNPATPIGVIESYISKVDKITIMTVDPGFAGQPFIPEMVDKIEQLKRLKNSKGYKYLIEVDGACNSNTFKILKEAGCEVFIVGSSGLFNLDSDLQKAWQKMIENFN